MHQNWLQGAPNPFDLIPPPDVWLREMWLFDDKLVLVPGQKRAVWILGRKATRSHGEPLHDVKGLTQNPDTLLLHHNRLVKVCEIAPTCLWDQRIFQRLAAHDIHRLGGWREVANRLDAMDAKNEDGIERAQHDALHARSVDAYRSYKTRIGERLSMTPNPHGRGTLKKTPVSVHVRKPTPAVSGPLVVTA